MKSLVKAQAKAGIWLMDSEVPNYGPSDILVKIRKTAICGTDIHIYHWDEWAQQTVKVPMVIGHEFVGDIIAMGSEVTGFSIGSRVSGEGHVTCGICRNCRAGRRHLCRKTEGIGYDRPGCFGEYFAIPASNVLLLPDEISDDEAAILDPFGNATHTALSFDMVGEDVLITGAGPVGIMAVAVARHAGARYVVITDVNDYRLNLAKQMGADRAVNVKHESVTDVMRELGMKEGFDVGMEMSGNPQAFSNLIEVMNHGGKVGLLGIPPAATLINWTHVIFRMITIKGIYGREMFDTWYKMISMLQSGVNIKPVITHHFPIDEYQEAFKVMASGNAGKVILEW